MIVSSIKPSNFVVKSNAMNQMISYKQRSPLSEVEQMVALAIISKISPEDTDFKDYEVTSKELSELTKINVQDLRGKYIDKICVSLITTAFTIKSEDCVIHVPFFTRAMRIKESGTVFFQFSPELKPHLLQLKGNFSKYGLNVIASLSGTYAKRIYELLNQWKTYGKPWVITLDDFKEMLFIDKNKYKRFNSFRSIVLDRAKDQINQKSDIKFEFETVLKGRKVIGLKFLIKARNPKKERKESVIPSLPKCIDYELLESLKEDIPLMQEREAILLVNTYGKAMLQEATLDLFRASRKGNVKDPVAYFQGILRKKQASESQQKPANSYSEKTFEEKLTDRSWDNESFDFNFVE